MSRLLSIFALAVTLAVGSFAISIPTAVTAVAQDVRTPSGLPVPRFESIDSTAVRMRQGPSTSHRILWVFENQEGLPVEIVAETEQWRQIRDPDGDLGWVYRPLLSSNRGAVIVGGMRAMRRLPERDAPIVAYMEPRVVVQLNECSDQWCQVGVDGHTGWVRHEDLWGVYPAEIVE